MASPVNEPILGYLKGSKERKALEEALVKYSAGPVHVPCVIGDDHFDGSGGKQSQPMPFDHGRKVK